MAEYVRKDEVAALLARCVNADSGELRKRLADEIERLPATNMAAGIPLWEFQDSFAPRETVWLKDPYNGRVVAKGRKQLRRFRDVTVTGCYPALVVGKDDLSVYAVLVCWGNHKEIEAAGGGGRRGKSG